MLAEVFARGEQVLAAVSGGADSVALLLLLHDAAREGRIELCAAHFEHGIRGEASREDERFVRELCARLSIPLTVGSGNVPAFARTRGMGIEQAARDARYAFLRDTMREVKADVIATAHHMDDQTETVLMHLFRGCGLKGLSGMSARRDDLARPLLHVRKDDLIAFLRERGQDWREDATNAAPDTPRNRLRHEVIPAAEAIYPGAVSAVARLARIVADEDALLSERAQSFLDARVMPIPGGRRVDLSGDPPRALVRRAFNELAGMSYELVERLWALNGGAMETSGGIRAERIGDRLYLLEDSPPSPQPVPLPVQGEVMLPGIGSLRVEPSEPMPERNDHYVQVLRHDALVGAVVRTRLPGDRIQPLGMMGVKKLKDYLIDRKVDRPLRDSLMLVARGSEVLWVVGVGISELTALREDAEAVKLTFLGIRYIETYK